MKACETCPFNGLTRAEKSEAVETDKEVEMLCHESRCLDGELPDRKCVGFYQERTA